MLGCIYIWENQISSFYISNFAGTIESNFAGTIEFFVVVASLGILIVSHTLFGLVILPEKSKEIWNRLGIQ